MPKYKNPQIKEIFEGTPMPWIKFKEHYNKVYDKEHKNMLLFAFLTGARPIEFTRLQRQDFELKGKNIVVKIRTAKGGTTRKIYLPVCNPETQDLKEYVIYSKVFPGEYIFPSLARVKNPRCVFMRKNKEAGIGIIKDDVFYPHSFYIFRHNIATLLAEEGVDFLNIRLFRGERLNPRMYGSLGHYLHFSEKMSLEVTAALRKILKATY